MGLSQQDERTLPPRFLTGHEVFDEIVWLQHGMSVLLLDQTFSQARNLLYVLLEHYGRSTPPIEITRRTALLPYGRVKELGDEPLTEVSIKVNAIRNQHPRDVIIHSYLPELLIKHSPEDVLKYVESWLRVTREAGTVEFYLLPVDSFRDVERKLVALLDGVIEIRVTKSEGKFASKLIPARCCRPEHNLREFDYSIQDARLLIQWSGEFVDRLTGLSREEIQRRVTEFRENLHAFRVKPGPNAPIVTQSVYDYWLLSQLTGKTLEVVAALFPEKIDGILERIARWQIDGVLELERDYHAPQAEPLLVGPPRAPRRIGFLFQLPLGFVSWLFRLRTGRARVVPADFYQTTKRAALAMVNLLMQREGIKSTPGLKSGMGEMERMFSEMAARLTTLQHINMLGVDVRAKLPIKHLPKLLRLTLLSGYNLNSKVKKLSETEYHIIVKDCFLCEGHESPEPVCVAIPGGIEAVCGIVHKSRINCREVKCKGMGDEFCAFRVTVS